MMVSGVGLILTGIAAYLRDCQTTFSGGYCDWTTIASLLEETNLFYYDGNAARILNDLMFFPFSYVALAAGAVAFVVGAGLGSSRGFQANQAGPVREHIESSESLVIQGRWPDSLGGGRRGGARIAGAMAEVGCLSERSDGHEWALVERSFPGQARRQSAACPRAGSRQRPDVYHEHRVSVAGDRQGPARSTLYDYFDRWGPPKLARRRSRAHSELSRCRRALSSPLGRPADPAG